MRSEGYGSWVCLLLKLIPLFVSQMIPHTQRAAKVRSFVRFSLKILSSKAGAVPILHGLVSHLYSAETVLAHYIHSRKMENSHFVSCLCVVREESCSYASCYLHLHHGSE